MVLQQGEGDGFPPHDLVGHTFSMSYPPSAPVYNITAMLTLVSSFQPI